MAEFGIAAVLMLCLVLWYQHYWHNFERRTALLRLGPLIKWFEYNGAECLEYNILQAEHAMRLLEKCQARTPDFVAYDEIVELADYGFAYDTTISLGANIVRMRAILTALKG